MTEEILLEENIVVTFENGTEMTKGELLDERMRYLGTLTAHVNDYTEYLSDRVIYEEWTVDEAIERVNEMIDGINDGLSFIDIITENAADEHQMNEEERNGNTDNSTRQ